MDLPDLKAQAMEHDTIQLDIFQCDEVISGVIKCPSYRREKERFFSEKAAVSIYVEIYISFRARYGRVC
jgi:hypothetical protein